MGSGCTRCATAAIEPDLQHLRGRNGDLRAAAVVERILVRNDGVQRVVAAAQVEDHEASRARTLGLGDLREEGRRGEADRERCDAAADEVST